MPEFIGCCLFNESVQATVLGSRTPPFPSLANQSPTSIGLLLPAQYQSTNPAGNPPLCLMKTKTKNQPGQDTESEKEKEKEHKKEREKEDHENART